MKRISVWAFAIGVLVVAGAGEARAQMSMAAFKGYLTGHVGAITAGDLSSARTALGASVAVHENDGWGAELDFGHTTDARAGAQVLDVTTYLINASWVKPAGRLRPFGLAGVGVMQIDGCDSPCNRPAQTYDLGLNVGGGTYVVLSDWLGFRGDARYFWSSGSHPDLRRAEDFRFWRVSAGVTFMWAAVP